MTIGLIGRKVGMTQLFQADGTMIPVSVVSVEPNIVTRLRTPERDGYAAVQLGIEESGRLTKPEIGQLKNLPKLAVIREFRLDDAGTEAYTVGQKLDVTLFTAGDVVDVVGVSKGKGFSGHIKRHHFKRGPKTHGSDHHRAPGRCPSDGTASCHRRKPHRAAWCRAYRGGDRPVGRSPPGGGRLC